MDETFVGKKSFELVNSMMELARRQVEEMKRENNKLIVVQETLVWEKNKVDVRTGSSCGGKVWDKRTVDRQLKGLS